MTTRIALPADPIFTRLIANKEEVCKKYDLQIFELDESKCFDLFLANKVDVALISPMTYGLGVGKTDTRIISVSAISLNGYCEVASLIFDKELKTFETIATNDSKSYLFNIAKLLLAERYDMDCKEIISDGSESELLNVADAAFVLGKSMEIFNSLDVGEEWLDTFEMPLPLAFWICKAEEYPENIGEILKELSGTDDIKPLHIIEEITVDSELPKREGSIIYEFNQEFEEALAQTLQFLFYHQLIPEIPEINILGREKDV